MQWSTKRSGVSQWRRRHAHSQRTGFDVLDWGPKSMRKFVKTILGVSLIISERERDTCAVYASSCFLKVWKTCLCWSYLDIWGPGYQWTTGLHHCFCSNYFQIPQPVLSPNLECPSRCLNPTQSPQGLPPPCCLPREPETSTSRSSESNLQLPSWRYSVRMTLTLAARSPGRCHARASLVSAPHYLTWCSATVLLTLTMGRDMEIVCKNPTA